jgi:cytoskeletal protein CcmA (bactofilin family)
VTCPPEAVLAEHADGELPREAALATAAHLEECARCREMLEALRGESRLLAAALEAAAARAEAPERRTSWVEGITLALVLVTAAAGANALWQWLAAAAEQGPISVLDERSIVLSALFEAVFFLLREGASMLTSLLEILGVLVLLAAVLGLSLWRRRAPGLLLLTVLLAVASSPSFALEQRIGKKGTVTIPAGETVDDSVLATGDTVSMEGVVTGNLLAFGRRVSVRGTVQGDLVACAQRVEIDGTVEGNVLACAEDFTLRGPVGRSLHVFAKHSGVEKEARVQGDILAFSQEVDFEGEARRDLFAFAGLTNLRGDVGRNASAWTGRLRVEDRAKVGGDLTAHVDRADQLSVESGAAIAGKTATVLGSKGGKGRSGHQSRYARPSFYLWRVIWLAAAFLTGLVLQRLWPVLFGSGVADVAVAWWLGIGLLALAAPPVAAVLLGLTVVGLPLALLTLAVWLAGLYVSGILVASLVGRALLTRQAPVPPPFAIALLVGLLAVTVAVNVPFLGGIVKLAVILLGLGIGVTRVVGGRRASLPQAG